MKNKFINTLSTAILMLTVTACGTTIQPTLEGTRGSGTIISTQRDVDNFSTIQIYMGADLILTQSTTESLIIEADDNVMQYIETRIENGRLIVSKPDHINLDPSQTIHLNVSFNTLHEIEIFGSSNIKAGDLDLDALAISFSGSGSTRLTGKVNEQTITIRGQATIKNFDLTSRHVVIDISGNGTIEVNAEEMLDVTVAGMGTIRYTGNPTVIENVNGTANFVQQFKQGG